ncbi:MAG: hypothetical protein Kow00120_09470 [Anaerolineae bacterium]
MDEGFQSFVREKMRLDRVRRRRALSQFQSRKSMPKARLRYEEIARWAADQWQARHPGQPFVTVWAAPECANKIAHQRIKPGRRLRGKARYAGLTPLPCTAVTDISEITYWGNDATLGATSGAFRFTFEATDTGAPFEAIFVASHFEDEVRDQVAVVVLPPERLESWVAFEYLCAEKARPRIRRRRDVYIIGGTDAFFEPVVDWEDVILPPDLKADLLDDIEAFFIDGVGIYQQLRLAPFRKLLLVGLPGTGKTMLCSALAKLTIARKRVVVYVSGADVFGASFEKIHRALHIVRESRQPVLLIVEELDAYLHAEDKARVLNVLDGVESPNNPKGVLMLATTNYPEIIDERVAKRPGRVDRIFVIPPIQDEDQALQMLRRYMGPQWRDEHEAVAPRLIDRTGAFVREVALQARMLAAHAHQTEVTLEFLKSSVEALSTQVEAGDDFLPRRPFGLVPETENHRNRRRRGVPFLPPDEVFTDDDELWEPDL